MFGIPFYEETQVVIRGRCRKCVSESVYGGSLPYETVCVVARVVLVFCTACQIHAYFSSKSETHVSVVVLYQERYVYAGVFQRTACPAGVRRMEFLRRDCIYFPLVVQQENRLYGPQGIVSVVKVHLKSPVVNGIKAKADEVDEELP